MKKIFSRYPFFLLLLPLFIIVHIEKSYHVLINYSFIQREILIILFAPAIAYLVSKLLFRQGARAAIFSFVLLFFFYYLGEIKNYLVEKIPYNFFSTYTFIIPATFVIIIAGYWMIRKSNSLQSVLLYLNCLITLAIAGDLFVILFATNQQNEKTETNLTLPVCTDCNKPDVYYIIFDSYTASPLLQSEFNFDNSQQDSFLIKNGFHVIRNSKSNYNLTPFCIGSTFGMNYLTGIDTGKKYHAIDYLKAVKDIYKSPLFTIFAQQGYDIVNHSIFDVENYPSTIPRYDQWRTDRLYQQYNIIRKMYNEIGWGLPSWIRISFGTEPEMKYVENRINHDSTTFAHLSNTVKNSSAKKPRFVYAHILLPHSPYFFDSSGNRIEPSYTLTHKEDQQGYVNQLVYTNKLIKNVVTEFMQNIKRPTIIIIQGDHGYRFFETNKKIEEFPNLNAIYLPKEYETEIPDSISGVNTFRWVLNLVFKQKIPLLEQKELFLKYK